jgi:L-threonylcarbamoyladenylate synthase
MESIIQSSIEKAAALLLNGEVVAIPTETVYGLAASINFPEAIDYIFELKGRPRTNPLIVHIATLEEVEKLCISFPEPLKKLAMQFWPGSLTLVLPKAEQVSNQITAGKNTVGIRIPNHPKLLQLLEKTGPIAAPSANPFERISPTTAKHVADYFPKGLKMVLDGGACQAGIESTIIGFEDNQVIVYRLGAISVEEIEKVVGPVSFFDSKKSKVVTPGMSKRHYAPQTKTIVTESIEDFIGKHSSSKIGLIVFKQSPQLEVTKEIILSPSGNLHEAAQRIYHTLHEFDLLDLDYIVIEPLPNHGLGRTVNDRLSRAVHTDN